MCPTIRAADRPGLRIIASSPFTTTVDAQGLMTMTEAVAGIGK
jgi:hypothetical protein